VFRRQVFEQREFEVLPGTPYEARCRLEVPAGAMHSFRSNHNEVQWKLVVRGDVAGWPNFERSYSIVVLPPKQPPTSMASRLAPLLAGQHS
jgi:hypothetical protein